MKSHSCEAQLSLAESEGMSVTLGLDSPSPVSPTKEGAEVRSEPLHTDSKEKDFFLCFNIPPAALQVGQATSIFTWTHTERKTLLQI